MKLPKFTAEASLYRAGGCYRVSCGGFAQGGLAQHVVLSLSTADEALCSNCLQKCAENLGICVGIATATAPFCIPCAGVALAECNTQSAFCVGYCNLPGQSCCPEFCYPGKCCGRGETCVDNGDPNSRYGCCPSDQIVCGGNCCPQRSTCCGGDCCPAGYFCVNGFCSQSVPFPSEPPPPPFNQGPILCEFAGLRPCQTSASSFVCCRPGLECCGARGCKTTCVG